MAMCSTIEGMNGHQLPGAAQRCLHAAVAGATAVPWLLSEQHLAEHRVHMQHSTQHLHANVTHSSSCCARHMSNVKVPCLTVALLVLPASFPAVQHFGHPHASIDIMRAARLGAYGLLIDGPVGSKWYDVLETYVFPKDPISTKAVLAKTALDQVVYATIMTGVCKL
jgi:hypothetical protein